MNNILRVSLILMFSAVILFAQDNSKDLSQMATEFNNPLLITTPGDGSTSTLSESFEDPAFPPAGWSLLNPDGGTGWTRLTVGTTPIPGWNGGTVTAPPGGGNAIAFATWNTGGATSNDQWIVTPQITNVQAGDMLNFWLLMPGYANGSYLDSVDILISTTGTNVGDFNVVVEQLFWPAASADTNWTQYSYTLTDFVSAGSDIYVGWREHVSDNFNDGAAICLDLIEVTGGGGTVSIDYAREDLNADFIPDHLGEILTIEGTISSPNYNTGNFNYVIHDGTAGISSIFFGYTGPEYNMGDVVQVTGEISQYNGLVQIEPGSDTDVVLMGTGGALPDFTVLTLAQFLANAEMYEGELIAFASLTAAGGGDPWPSSGSNANFNLTDAIGVDVLAMRIDKETDLDDNPEPIWPKDVVGFGGQFSTATPPNDGYQLLARMYSEILPPGTVPVELTSFSANVVDGEVILNWITATEINNLGFEVERKSNDNFITIGFVDGYGTTTETHNYSYSDNTVKSGSYSYRLKQMDFNGNYEYSEVIIVEVVAPVNYSLEQNYPNPFNPATQIVFNLAFDSKVTLTVFNVLGERVLDLVNSNFVAGIQKIDFDASSLNSGVYFYRIDAAGVDGTNFSSIKKMILTK